MQSMKLVSESRTKSVTKSLYVAAAITAAGLTSTASALPIIDGTRDAEYGPAFAVQAANTSFADSIGGYGGSELDNFSYKIDIPTGKLNLFFGGNIESNGNKLVIFIDSKAGGQNSIRGDNPDVGYNNLNLRYGPSTVGGVNLPGFTFDTAFTPDYFVQMNRDGGGVQVDFSELKTNGGGNGGFLGGAGVPSTDFQQGAGPIGGYNNLPSAFVGFDNSNSAGVNADYATAANQTAAAAVSTGTEMQFDLSAFDIEGDFKLMAFVNGTNADFASNQFIGAVPVGKGSLGGDNAGTFIVRDDIEGFGVVAGVNLASIAGNQFVTIPVTLPSFSWKLNANGNYSNTANFNPTGTLPTGGNGRVTFGNAITAPRTVTIDTDISLVSLAFDNANAYTLAGTKTITIAGSSTSPAVKVLSGNHVVSAPLAFVNDTRVDVAVNSSLSLSGVTSAAGRNLFKQGLGTLTFNVTGPNGLVVNSLTSNAGTLKLNGTGNTYLRGVTVDTGASLDVTNTAIIVDYDDGYTPIEALRAAIADGRFKSTTRLGMNFAIGYLDSAALPALVQFNGTPLDATALVFRATFKGDSNLNGLVNFDDLVPLAQNYNKPGKNWYEGDFTGDGIVNFDDLVPLAQNYNKSVPAAIEGELAAIGGAAFASDWALAQSLVPEPTSLAALASAGLILVRRRK